MCGSKNYPYLPYKRDFFLSTPPPHLSGNSSLKNVIHLPKFLDLYPPGISNPFCGGRLKFIQSLRVVITSSATSELTSC